MIETSNVLFLSSHVPQKKKKKNSQREISRTDNKNTKKLGIHFFLAATQ